MAVASSSREDIRAKVRHWILFGGSLDNSNEPETNRLQPNGSLYGCKVRISCHNGLSVCPGTNQLVQYIAPVKVSVDEER